MVVVGGEGGGGGVHYLLERGFHHGRDDSPQS